MSNINFDNPYLLLIAVPLIVLFTVPFVIAVRKDNRNGHNITSQIMHVLLAVIIGFAAAGTTIETVLTATQVFVVADVSYSESKNLDTIDDVIKNRLDLPSNTTIGVVVFGKEPKLLCGLGRQRDVKSVKNSGVDDSESNIAEALRFAGTQFTRDDVVKRIVLITDGRQTDERDTNAMRRAVDWLESNSIKVDAYFVAGNNGNENPEVQISSAQFTPSAFINHDEVVYVTIQSTHETQCVVELYKDGVLYTSRTIPNLSIGRNQARLDLDTSVGGTFDYELRLRFEGNIKEKDTNLDNNVYTFTQSVSSELKVLMLTNNWDTVSTLINQYGPDATIDLYENAPIDPNSALNDQQVRGAYYSQFKDNDKINLYCFDENLSAESASGIGITAKMVPYTVEELCLFDEIVLADFDLTSLGGYAISFIEGVDVTVGQLGKSLVTIGNTSIQDKSADELDKLSNMLPVRYGKAADAPVSYTIVIDQSISLLNNGRFEIGKELAISLIDILDPDDYVTVIAFYGDNEFVWETGPLGDNETTQKVKQGISNLTVKNGTNVLGPLNRVYAELSGYSEDKFSGKQVMLITDGKDMADLNRSGAESLVEEMAGNGFVVSVFDLGGDQQNDGSLNNSTYSSFLQRLAAKGNGKYYSQTPGQDGLDKDVFGDLAEQEGKKVVDLLADPNNPLPPAAVTAKSATDEVLYGLSKTGIPGVYGYVTSTAKLNSTTVLTLTHKETGKTDRQIPLYAYCSYGNGKVSTFTSTFGWAKLWTASADNNVMNGPSWQDVFFDNVMDTNVPKKKSSYPYTFNVKQNGSKTTVTVTPPKGNLRDNAQVRITVKKDDTEIIANNLSLQLNGIYYEYEFRSAAVGRYVIEVSYFYNTLYTSTEVINVAYTDEYNEFNSYTASPLYKAINGRGEIVESGELKIENKASEMGVFTQDLTFPLLIAAVALFVVDIVIRKLKWEDVVSFFGGYKKKNVTNSGGTKK